MFINKPISFAKQTPYKTSGKLMQIDKDELVHGMKKIKVIKQEYIRCDIKDITSLQSFDPNYEFYENILEVKTDDSLFSENYNYFMYNGYIFSFLDRVQNFNDRTTTIRYGYNGIKGEDIGVI